MVGARHVVVMVVVPAFAHRQKCEPEVVAARVFRRVTPTSPDVRERVDRERRVQKHACGHDVSPQEPVEAKGQREADAEGKGADEMVTIEPAQLGISREVGNDVGASFFVFATKPPTDVRVPKSASCGTVQITLGVRVFVVQTMRSRPPQWTFLCRHRSKKREHQLEDAAGLVGAMREVAVVDARDRKHAHEVRCDCDQHEFCGDVAHQRKCGTQVNGDEGEQVEPLIRRQTSRRRQRHSHWCSNVLRLLGLHALIVSNGLQMPSSITS